MDLIRNSFSQQTVTEKGAGLFHERELFHLIA